MGKSYIVNTNRTNNPAGEDEVDMIGMQKCAAYYDPWKHKIDAIKANEMVFLYSNQRGIIARGVATGIVEVKDYRGDVDEEHYMNLEKFQYLRNPLLASKVSEIVGYSVVWGQTMVSMNEETGLKVWQYITRNCL
ncbi:hypothetical protein DFP93_106111 [Aneurinibacillus soli]|uniref:Uncharacterized protein n=1 Tax=Aneurinibacillus soli TaxID=1500254 RepID=A0A0U5BHG4_9BACL|nr:hypothetical protein [Aneurinibacillus soli]PYE61918.1 hypothetical protein DFP93_106111 [Aneurinibacillus soli]BAU29735.1 hypothetical protein CB4_03972 [Aneurinibacillus soli]